MAWMRAICRFPGLKGFLIYGQRVSLLPRTNISPNTDRTESEGKFPRDLDRDNGLGRIRIGKGV